jgi:hypothetical protein
MHEMMESAMWIWTLAGLLVVVLFVVVIARLMSK